VYTPNATYPLFIYSDLLTCTIGNIFSLRFATAVVCPFSGIRRGGPRTLCLIAFAFVIIAWFPFTHTCKTLLHVCPLEIVICLIFVSIPFVPSRRRLRDSTSVPRIKCAPFLPRPNSLVSCGQNAISTMWQIRSE
jgi:hypothetical protein